MTIGIIIAMDKEFRGIAGLLKGAEEQTYCGRQFVTGRLGENTLVLHQCGIGKVNAAIGVTTMIARYQSDVVISTGCAGGADSRMKVQDVVVSTQLTYHDVYCGEALGHTVYGQVQGMPARYATPHYLVEQALQMNGSAACGGATIHAGTIVTGDWFVDTKDKMRDILRLFPDAAAVDMESAAIAHTCHVFGVPFVSFRVISDIPLLDTNASQYHDFWQHVADESFALTRQYIEHLQLPACSDK